MGGSTDNWRYTAVIKKLDVPKMGHFLKSQKARKLDEFQSLTNEILEAHNLTTITGDATKSMKHRKYFFVNLRSRHFYLVEQNFFVVMAEPGGRILGVLGGQSVMPKQKVAIILQRNANGRRQSSFNFCYAFQECYLFDIKKFLKEFH